MKNFFLGFCALIFLGSPAMADTIFVLPQGSAQAKNPPPQPPGCREFVEMGNEMREAVLSGKTDVAEAIQKRIIGAVQIMLNWAEVITAEDKAFFEGAKGASLELDRELKADPDGHASDALKTAVKNGVVDGIALLVLHEAFKERKECYQASLKSN